MTFSVAIRENATGEIRFHREDFDWSETAEYMWLDGNYACDCNRRLFFARAAAIEPDDDRPCGDSAYTALYAELPCGRRIDLDLLEPAPVPPEASSRQTHTDPPG